jgi:hypothetical protein
MATLVQHLRSVLAAESDDFFKDETLLFYLNKSQHRVVSLLTALESKPVDKSIPTPPGGNLNVEKSLRALDSLRKTTTVTPSAAAQLGSTTTYQRNFTLPTTVLQILSLRHIGFRTVRELPVTKINYILDGNHLQSDTELFYYVFDDAGTKKVQMFGPAVFTGNTDIFFISTPTLLTVNSTTLASLPLQLENAVVYGAAEMALLQESVKDPNNSVQALQAIYQQELSGAIF